MGMCLVFPGVRYLVGAGGGVQDRPDVIERCAAVRAQEAVVSACDETLWQHMLEKAADELFRGKSQAFPLSVRAVLAPECHVAVCELFNAVIGDGDPADRGCEVGKDCCAGSGRFAVDNPFLFPDLGWHLVDQAGCGQRVLALTSKDLGERFDGNKPVLVSGREPRFAIR